MSCLRTYPPNYLPTYLTTYLPTYPSKAENTLLVHKDKYHCSVLDGQSSASFSSFQPNITILTANKCEKCLSNICAGIRTHDLWNISLLYFPLDQGSRPCFTSLNQDQRVPRYRLKRAKIMGKANREGGHFILNETS